MPAQSAATQTLPLIRLAVVFLIVGGLYLGKPVLVPIAVAALLSFLLSPVADWLERWHLPRPASVVAVALLAFVILGGVISLMTAQVVNVAESLPHYSQNIKQRFRVFQDGESSVFGETAQMFEDIQTDLDAEHQQAAQTSGNDLGGGPAPATDTASGTGEKAQRKPTPVMVHEPPPSAFDLIKKYAAPLLGPLGMAGLSTVLTIFMLLQREDLRDRLIRLTGYGRLDMTTRALNEASNRISRYLLMQLTINCAYGVPVGVGLWLIGVPGAPLWGLLAILLRFIPYLGPWLSASMPIVLSLAVFDGWVWPLAVVGLFVGLELCVNTVLEPLLYGASTGLSPVAVVLAVMFWSFLWGGIGLLLAIPLTACLVVVGRYVRQLESFSILLGKEPALPPAPRLYQRMLAGDDDAASALVRAQVEERGLIDLFDHVVVPALHLAERDRHEARLEPERLDFIYDGARRMLETLRDSRPVSTRPQRGACPVFCLAAHDQADDLIADMLVQVLSEQGVRAETLSARRLAGEALQRMEHCEPPLVCISALPPAAVPYARYLCKRVKQRFTDAEIAVGIWDTDISLQDQTAVPLTDAGADDVLGTLAEAASWARRRIDTVTASSPDGVAAGAAGSLRSR